MGDYLFDALRPPPGYTCGVAFAWSLLAEPVEARVMSRRILCIALAAACGAAVAGTWAGPWASSSRGVGAAPSPVESKAVLVVDTAKLNLGAMWETDRFELTIPVTDNEQHPIEIEEIESLSATCNCLLIEPRTLTVGPGEKRALRPKKESATGCVAPPIE